MVDELRAGGPRLGTDDVLIRQLFFKCTELIVSLVDSRPQEVVCVYFRGLEFAGVRQQHSPVDVDYTMVFETRYCQVDNCLINARFPVIVWPQSLQRTFFRLVLSGRSSGELWILSEARVSVQPLDLFVEEAVAMLLLRWRRDCKKAWPAAITLMGGGSSALSSTTQGGGFRAPRKLLIDLLRIDPIKLTVSMQRLVDSPVMIFGFPEWKVGSPLAINSLIRLFCLGPRQLSRERLRLAAFSFGPGYELCRCRSRQCGAQDLRGAPRADDSSGAVADGARFLREGRSLEPLLCDEHRVDFFASGSWLWRRAQASARGRFEVAGAPCGVFDSGFGQQELWCSGIVSFSVFHSRLMNEIA